VSANPQHAGALNDLGLCLARQGKLEASVQFIEQAIQLQPTKALYRNNAATVLVEMRQDQRALAHLAAAHGPAEANYNFGQLLVQRGRATDAVPYFQVAIEQNPQMQAAHVALAKLRGEAAQDPAVATPTPAMPPDVPTSVPLFAPQNTPASGPQFSYPATARSPELGASSYLPPRYYAPMNPYPATGAPGRQGARVLPPVAIQPAAVPVQR
jgi:tetratricopeptide (TPR) repeat protein